MKIPTTAINGFGPFLWGDRPDRELLTPKKQANRLGLDEYVDREHRDYHICGDFTLTGGGPIYYFSSRGGLVWVSMCVEIELASDVYRLAEGLKDEWGKPTSDLPRGFRWRSRDGVSEADLTWSHSATGSDPKIFPAAFNLTEQKTYWALIKEFTDKRRT